MSAIFADVNCDLQSTELKKLNINLVDTSMSDVFLAFKQAFQPYLDEEEDIIYLSSNLKSVEEPFNQAVKYFSNLYEGRIIRGFDLDACSSSAGLIVYEAGLMYKRGCTDLEIIDFVNDFKSETYGFLITQNKEFLTKRCSNLDKFNVNSMSNLIFPIIYVKNDKFEILDKAQGKKKAIGNIINVISDNSVNVADYPFIVGYSDDEVNAQYFKTQLVKHFGEDTTVMLQKFNKISESQFDKKSLYLGFYSKKIRN